MNRPRRGTGFAGGVIGGREGRSCLERPDQTVADYVAIVLSPRPHHGAGRQPGLLPAGGLLPADGQYEGPLQWILFFFVFGAVLVARISMTGEHRRPAAAVRPSWPSLTWLGMQAVRRVPRGGRSGAELPRQPGPDRLVWWCAHRLTWDCTNVDEDADMSGEGLLQAAGLEEARQRRRRGKGGRRRSQGKKLAACVAGAPGATASSARRTQRWASGWSTSRWRRCRCSGWASRSSR